MIRTAGQRLLIDDDIVITIGRTGPEVAYLTIVAPGHNVRTEEVDQTLHRIGAIPAAITQNLPGGEPLPAKPR